MSGLTLAGAVGLGVAALLVHALAVALTRALRTYSRSRLEEICAANGHPDRADQIAHHDDRTERAAGALAVLSGLALAALLGAAIDRFADRLGPAALIAGSLALAALGHGAAGIAGRVYAEVVLDALWPLAVVVRHAMMPLTTAARAVEALAYRRGRRSAHGNGGVRPTSVEVEIHLDDGEQEEDIEAELPESARETLEQVVELTRCDVADVMTPRAAIRALPASVHPREAARAFAETGFSRIPLYGVNRDDIVGILYAKDLYPTLLADGGEVVAPRKLVRAPLFVPETKNAFELLEEFRARRVQMAIVVDEYGAVVGLATLEDLLEELIGAIDDEHDQPSAVDIVVPLRDGGFEVDATLGVEELNERLDLHLPTDGDYTTLGGLAFSVLGRVPTPGETFRADGVAFTVLEVAAHSIRRLRLDLQPNDQPAPARLGD